MHDVEADPIAATLPAVRGRRAEIAAAFAASIAATHPAVLRALDSRYSPHGADVLVGALLTDAAHTGPGTPVSSAQPVGPSGSIRPDQFLLIGRHLSIALERVLGAHLTPDLLARWDDVCWSFAADLAAAEEMSAQHDGRLAGLAWRPWRIRARTDTAVDTVTFTLEPADRAPVPDFVPGQYLPIGVVPRRTGSRLVRYYTVLRGPDGGSLRITVRRLRGHGGAPDGVVSGFLHDHAHPGDVLDVGPIAGDVTLAPGPGPVVLISAGVGITYAAALLDHIARSQRDRPVVAVHCDRSAGTHPLAAEVAAMAGPLRRFRQVTSYDDTDGPLRVETLPLAPGADVYVCGPLEFMRTVRAGLLRRGVPPHRLHYEVFGPDRWAARLARPPSRAAM